MGRQPLIKICGVRDAETAAVAARCGADLVGLVFAPRSVRFLEESEAAAVIAALPPSVQPVGLFVDPDRDPDAVTELIERLGLPAVQLHGRAGRTARRLGPVEVWRAVPFELDRFEADVTEAEQWRAEGVAVRGLIVDTPDVTGIGGGTGRRLDAEALREILDHRPLTMPFLLAGGLNPRNVVGAIERVRPAGVDVSSGVESTRGVKDPDRIAEFCAAVRSISRDSDGPSAA